MKSGKLLSGDGQVLTISADTNLLVRLAVQDDVSQAQAASAAIRGAKLVAVPLPALCEFAWVLRSVYRFNAADAAMAVRALLDVRAVKLDREAVQAGLAALDSGGDFADAVIAHEGRRMGGEVFTSFDRRAVALLAAQGFRAQLLV